MQGDIFVPGASHHNCRQLDVPTVGKVLAITGSEGLRQARLSYE